MAKYGKRRMKSGQAMHDYRHGLLKSGKVRSRKQAVAIGLSQARKAGADVPAKRK